MGGAISSLLLAFSGPFRHGGVGPGEHRLKAKSGGR
jgi:hypothetical protein